MAGDSELLHHVKEAVQCASTAVRGVLEGGAWESQVKKDGIDRVTGMDMASHHALRGYFERQGIPVSFLGEEGTSTVRNAQISILSDELDGTVNADQLVRHLPFGINVCAGEYRPTMLLSDMTAAAVADVSNNVLFTAERGRGSKVYVDGKEVTIGASKPLGVQVPLGYMKDPETINWQQRILGAISGDAGVGIEHLRSVDASGPESARTGINYRVVADGRRATKPWDYGPSSVILDEHPGVTVTDIFGFPFREAVLLKDDQLNMEVGKTLLAATSDDHPNTLRAILGAYLSMKSGRLVEGESGARFQAGLLNTYGKNEVIEGLGKHYAGIFNQLVSDAMKNYGFDCVPSEVDGLKLHFRDYLSKLNTGPALHGNTEKLVYSFFNHLNY